jgi:hypothetical protein
MGGFFVDNVIRTIARNVRREIRRGKLPNRPLRWVRFRDLEQPMAIGIDVGPSWIMSAK